MLTRLALALLLLGALGYGLAELFLLRFSTGEVYPPYSTLRVDPLGGKAFYEALDALPQYELQRNFRPITKLSPTAPVTLLYAGTPVDAVWGAEELRHVEALAAGGSRIVITFLPIERRPQIQPKPPSAKSDAHKSEKHPEETPDEQEESKPVPFSEVAKRWDFAFGYSSPRDPSATPRQANLQSAEVSTEPSLSWHSALHFDALGGKWRTLYAFEKQPLLIERPFGAGSLVLAADSYFLSNEALRKERTPRLLAWLVGNSSTIIFDEESHGVRENPGVVTLLRRYRLHGVAAGLLLIAALFVWKNATPFVPAFEEPNVEGDLVIGKQAEEGFINLLRRAVPPTQVLAVCAEEWKKTCDPTGESPQSAHLEKVLANERARPARERNPVAAYRTISAVLSRKT